MSTALKYGRTEIVLEPRGRELPVIAGQALSLLPWELIGEKLRALVPEGRRLGLLVPDGTRPLPIAALLDELAPAFDGRMVTVFIANGTHRLMSPQEIHRHLGVWAERFHVIQNHPADAFRFRCVGTTALGTPVELRSEALACDALFGLTLVRPHYYAGFSGGRKILLPGIASKASIQANHSLVLDKDPARGKDPRAVLASLDDNPVHLDMMEAARFIPIPCSLAHFIYCNGKVADVFASFEDAVARNREMFEVRTDEKYDALVISSGGAPYDINFIQAHKAMENAAGGLKPGGDLYAAMECPEGFGSPDCLEFLKLGSIEAVTWRLREEFKVYGHTALTILLKAKKFRIHLHSALSEEHVRLMGFEPWDGRSLPDLPAHSAVIPQGGMVYFPQG